MMCINTYSLIERICVEYPSYILLTLPLILTYRRKNVIRIEGIDYWLDSEAELLKQQKRLLVYYNGESDKDLKLEDVKAPCASVKNKIACWFIFFFNLHPQTLSRPHARIIVLVHFFF